MRHVLKGALGAALVYPAVWYGSALEGPEPARGAPQRAAAAAARPSAPGEPIRPATELAGPTRAQSVASGPRPEAARPTLQELPAAFGAPLEADRPALPAVSEPGPPSQAFADVRDALGKMSDLQAHADDPKELERRVQTMEENPEQLARLKALAEMFVQLPPSRLDPYMSPREGGVSSGSR